MKRKEGRKPYPGTDDWGKLRKKLGDEVTSISRNLSWDLYRRQDGLDALRGMEVGEESNEKSITAEEQKRTVCVDLGESLSNMLKIRNMEIDWKEEGWMHFKGIFCEAFIGDLLLQEVELVMSTGNEERRGDWLKKSILYRNEDMQDIPDVFNKCPIHQYVLRKLMATLAGPKLVVRETMCLAKDGKSADGVEMLCESLLSEKKMRELGSLVKALHDEPVAVLIPLGCSLHVTTYQQYKKKTGRPRKGKNHVVDTGDLFILNWRQIHSIGDITETPGKAPKWIVIAGAKKQEDLMY
jgi:hypothetical protein